LNYSYSVKIPTAEAMRELGHRIGLQCRAGDLILLNGPLGAGKTILVQGIGEALGVADVTSPTFVISRIHKAPLPLIHVDVYRLLEDGKAALYLDDLDLDSPREEAVTVIEWGGEESARLSEDRLEIVIDRSDDIREVTVTTIGARWNGFSL
jgi:tRNA threonylcarbamoyladenosine biosynthesis protein TsaE